jgi:hypothetical protein
LADSFQTCGNGEFSYPADARLALNIRSGVEPTRISS